MESISRFIVGPLFVLGGLWFLAIPFAFAATTFGDREVPPGWEEYFGKTFEGALSAIAIGLLMVIIGLCWALGWPYSSDRESRL
ncbi:hypothetical protein [Paludisphaera rhizosphaerae]|uniref:hypothetical protein n=1 Tax=Paludisphaera rhizosphaerae TaxID=2711216 RepID=UPI0013EBFBA0|nr:hypothetical protein [Paludisphaera rhizosphaerae]